MNASVLFIDDDRRLIRLYADAVAERGVVVHCLHGVDDALRYLEKDNSVNVIVWDMMMAPGVAFAGADTQGGIAIGRFLLDKMVRLLPDAAFVLLTNLTPGDLDEDDSHVRQRSSYRFKPDTPPEELADLVEELLKKQKQSRGDGP